MKVAHIQYMLGAMLLATLAVVGCGGSSSSTSTPSTPGVSGVHSAYVANSGAGTISEFAIDTNGVLKEISGSPFNISANATALAITPDGNLLYAMDPAKKTIVEMSINSTSGVLTTVGTQTTTATPSSLAISTTGKFLYVGNSDANNISVYSIGSDGKLTEGSFSPVAVNGPVNSLAVSPKGTYLFASIPSTGVVYEFTVDTTTGALTANAGSPISIGSNPQFVAVATDETYIIVLDQNGLIRRMNMDSTGALTLAAYSPFTAGANPVQAVISSGYIYLVGGSNRFVTSISFQSNGAPAQASTIALGTGPSSIAISGSYLYATNQGDNTVSEFSIAAGAGTALNPATVTTGVSPDAIAVR